MLRADGVVSLRTDFAEGILGFVGYTRKSARKRLRIWL
jgi:hypothetical protein